MRILFALCAVLLSAVSYCETSYVALYLGGNKIGYAEYATSGTKLNGKAVTRSDSKTVMDAGMLGASLSVEMKSSTWSDKAGKPVQMTFTMSSSGRSQNMTALFGAKSVAITVNNSGQKTNKSLPMPNGAVIDDPTALIINGSMKPGTSKTFYVLDPMTVSFVKNEIKLVGKGKATVKGKKYDATIVEIVDPRASTTVYLSAKGDLIKMDGPMGIEMIPVSRAIALAPPGKYAPSKDLALATKLTTNKPIDDPASLRGLKLRVTAKNLGSIPSDAFQTVTKDGDGWIIDIHPPQLDAAPSATIAEAAQEKPDWTKPGLHIPSGAAQFKDLAKKVVGDKDDVQSASLAIQKWVYSQMKPNAGIGVLRDATEIVKTKEGVCRDYAILTVTLLRAAGIPARLASGLVNWDGSFYYHAWAESWDGSRWIGIDSTTDQEQISASHVKLGEGNVEEAFTFTFLDRAKLEVLGTKR